MRCFLTQANYWFEPGGNGDDESDYVGELDAQFMSLYNRAIAQGGFSYILIRVLLNGAQLASATYEARRG